MAILQNRLKRTAQQGLKLQTANLTSTKGEIMETTTTTINTKLLQVLTKLQADLNIESFEIENLGADTDRIEFMLSSRKIDCAIEPGYKSLVFNLTYDSVDEGDETVFNSIEALIIAIKPR